jgi:hypothetical protein
VFDGSCLELLYGEDWKSMGANISALFFRTEKKCEVWELGGLRAGIDETG